ncbi:hypothetical protein BDV36DRAFT_131472 [Aspergillus pseudocaelatus]|uniref:Uncharacterized protein n=1 Tax=Aspergillus pseudocaelatus TaxID=1825620 RepID=A0ABQ6VZB7_9EURO|nr:hypothetical protein BDV36DRAFT_131472 [Aspergillus pseudocaelatus]
MFTPMPLDAPRVPALSPLNPLMMPVMLSSSSMATTGRVGLWRFVRIALPVPDRADLEAAVASVVALAVVDSVVVAASAVAVAALADSEVVVATVVATVVLVVRVVRVVVVVVALASRVSLRCPPTRSRTLQPPEARRAQLSMSATQVHRLSIRWPSARHHVRQVHECRCWPRRRHGGCRAHWRYHTRPDHVIVSYSFLLSTDR